MHGPMNVKKDLNLFIGSVKKTDYVVSHVFLSLVFTKISYTSSSNCYLFELNLKQICMSVRNIFYTRTLNLYEYRTGVKFLPNNIDVFVKFAVKFVI